MENDCEQIFRPWFKGVVIGCFALLTVNAIITKHFSPVRIKKFLTDAKHAEVVDGRLVLNNCGAELQFPLLKYVPQNDVVDAALRKGIEIRANGTAVGVLQIQCPGFFNPVSYKERYVNLVALAIVTDPMCVNATADESIAELMAIVSQIPTDNRLCSMSTDGWCLANTACLNAVSEVIEKMPQARCTLKTVSTCKDNNTASFANGRVGPEKVSQDASKSANP